MNADELRELNARNAELQRAFDAATSNVATHAELYLRALDGDPELDPDVTLRYLRVSLAARTEASAAWDAGIAAARPIAERVRADLLHHARRDR